MSAGLGVCIAATLQLMASIPNFLMVEYSPVSFPLLNPYGHVAFQAQRGDVHTVLVDGRVVKHEGRLVELAISMDSVR